MPVNMLSDYPELIVATVLSLCLLAVWASRGGQVSAPAWLCRISGGILQALPQPYREWLFSQLQFAGLRSRERFDDFASLKVAALALSWFSILFLAPLAVLALSLLAFFLPDVLLSLYVKRRQREILDSLPQALDLMVLCVDAGLGLDATLKRIATEKTVIASALNDELNILGRDILLGLDRQRAYQELYRRTGVEELKTLGVALNQAGKLGLSIGKILRAQSDFMRKKQSQQAEEKAMKLPVLMSFPLWFCIMPALLLLVLGPSILRFFQGMGIMQ